MPQVNRTEGPDPPTACFPAEFRSGASRSSNMPGEQVIDEGLIAQPSPLRLPSHSVEDLGIDSNGNESPGLGAQRRSPHASHHFELGGGRLWDVGKVHPATTPCTLPAPSGSPGAR